MKDRLIELLENIERNCGEDFPVPKEIIANDLIANGVIVPPVKVGQNGYWITSSGVMLVTFDKVLLSVGNEWKVRGRYFVKEIVYFRFEDFGKTVFLTKEEAEKALAESEDTK